jgi:hypothetical protein
MFNFLIQKIDNEICYDFCFELIEAIKYHKWYYQNKCNYNYVFSNNYNKEYKKFIPVGSVEFVSEILKYQYNIKNIKPLNIPTPLLSEKFLKRKIFIKDSNEKEINLNKKIFIKNDEIIKGEIDIINKNEYIPEGRYIVSEMINIESEWRIFVYENKIVGCNFYLGNPIMFPDINLIKNMIETFNYEYPYTIDVGISEKGTFLIECHDFFSCGLYGFSNHKILPTMFIRTINMLISKYKIP